MSDDFIVVEVKLPKTDITQKDIPITKSEYIEQLTNVYFKILLQFSNLKNYKVKPSEFYLLKKAIKFCLSNIDIVEDLDILDDIIESLCMKELDVSLPLLNNIIDNHLFFLIKNQSKIKSDNIKLKLEYFTMFKSAYDYIISNIE